MKNYLTTDEATERFVVIVNNEVESMGRILNAVGHVMAGLVGGVGKGKDYCFVDYKDADGQIHPSISHFPVIVLRAKNAAHLAKLRGEAEARKIAFTDFTSTMTIGQTIEQLEATAKTSTAEHDYIALAMFGDTDLLREFTGQLSLFR